MAIYLSAPHLALLAALEGGKQAASELAETAGYSEATVQVGLPILVELGLITEEEDGYTLTTDGEALL